MIFRTAGDRVEEDVLAPKKENGAAKAKRIKTRRRIAPIGSIYTP